MQSWWAKTILKNILKIFFFILENVSTFNCNQNNRQYILLICEWWQNFHLNTYITIEGGSILQNGFSSKFVLPKITTFETIRTVLCLLIY